MECSSSFLLRAVCGSVIQSLNSFSPRRHRAHRSCPGAETPVSFSLRSPGLRGEMSEFVFTNRPHRVKIANLNFDISRPLVPLFAFLERRSLLTESGRERPCADLS